MGRSAAWLSDKQIEVLGWVRDGCPAGDATREIGRRVTAHALERRGLITIKGRSSSWRAVITHAGLACLARHHRVEPSDADAEELFASVIAADGPLEFPRDEPRALHEKLVQRSERSIHRPRGWRLKLVVTGPPDDRRDAVVLVRHFWDLVDPAPVPVPEHVTQYHPMVRAFRDLRHPPVSKALVGRASRILQAIADEAPRRGLEVLGPDQATIGIIDPYRLRQIERGDLILRSDAGLYAVRIAELTTKRQTAAEPTARDGRRPASSWPSEPEYVASGNLELVVEGPGTTYGGDRYRDAKTIPVEDKLPRVFRAIEVYRLEGEWRAHEREREAEDRRRRWEAAMADAMLRYEEEARWNAFERLSRTWGEVNQHRAFLAAAREAAAFHSDTDRDNIVAHLDLVERRLDEHDPIRHLERLPAGVPDPKPEDLRPFLHGWSPSGPEG